MSPFLAALVMLLAGSSSPWEEPAAGKAMAIIWRGDAKTAEEGGQLGDRWSREGKPLVTALVHVPEGYPRVIPSASYKAMRPGFFPLVLGFCPADQGQHVVEVLQKVDPEIYGRVIDGPAEPCPLLPHDPIAVGPVRVKVEGGNTLEATLLRMGYLSPGSPETRAEDWKPPRTVLVAVVRDPKGKILGRRRERLDCDKLTLGRLEDQLIIRGVCPEICDGESGCCGVAYRWTISARAPAEPDGERVLFSQERGRPQGYQGYDFCNLR